MPRGRRLVGVVAAIGATIVLIVVAAIVLLRVLAQPEGPDAFYEPPTPLPAGPPGTLVRSEPIDALAGRAWRVLYLSTGLDGAPIAVSGIVVAPEGQPPPGGWPVVAWAHGTSGIASRCAPSLFDEHGQDRIPELAALVDAGAVVVATDYPGLGTPGPHPYLVGQSEGRAVLDAARAASVLLPGEASRTTAVYGHSQGGHASLFASIAAAEYAPELDLVGVAAMAPPTALGELLNDDIGEVDGVVLTAFAVASWSAIFPQADEATIVDPLARPFVADFADLCVVTTAQGLSAVPDVLALEVGFLATDPTTAPGWGELLTENAPGDVPPSVPFLVAQGETDTLVRPDVTKAYVDQQCGRGANIELYTYAGVDHFGVRTAAAPDVLRWLQSRLAGEAAPAGCSTKPR